MSINITDRVGDNVETLVENTNEAITTVNNQLDSSVLANLTTDSKDTLVNAINELNMNKLDANATKILNDFSISGDLEANSIIVNKDGDGNSSVYFYDTTSAVYIKLFWNNSLRKWQLSFPDGSVVDILNSNDLTTIQTQINDIVESIDYNFNTNGNTLVLKQLSASEINGYVGTAGEIVLNSSVWGEIRVCDGVTAGGIPIVADSPIVDWEPNTTYKKGQCIFYGDGIYRVDEAFTSGNTFDESKCVALCTYKKIVESQVVATETNTITLENEATDIKNIDVNIGGLVVQKSNYTLIDKNHLRFTSNIPSNTSVEITHYSASTLTPSIESLGLAIYTAPTDNTTDVPLNTTIMNSISILEVNVENTSLLRTEWSLRNDNLAIVLKNGVKAGTRIQVTYAKNIEFAQNGVTFTPSVVNGVLSWTNDGGLENPDSISVITTNTTQTINATKTFNNLKVPTKAYTDSSTAAASTEFVHNLIAESDLGSNASASFPLFSILQTDHYLEDASWLRGDTFSWQSGDIYVAAYNELVAEWNAGYTAGSENNVNYGRTAKGYRICGANQEEKILNAYNTYGAAWFYILDMENKRFKLPRTQQLLKGLNTGVGNTVNLAASGSAIRATEMYTYFYVGNTVRNTTLIDVGKLMEDLNNFKSTIKYWD